MVTLLLLLLSLLPGRAQAAESVPPVELTPIQVAPQVYYFQGQAGMASAQNKGFMSNAGFVVTRDGVVVFDALATPALGAAMVRAIARVTAQPVRRVVLSHYHADHFYGLQALKQQGAEIWAHGAGKATLASEFTQTRLAERRVSLAPWVDGATRLLPADRWLEFGKDKQLKFELGGMHFTLLDVGGAHSPEDLMLYVEEAQVLFAGDLFFTGRIPFVGDADSKAWLQALARFPTGPKVVIPGHGPASTTPQADLALTTSYLLYLREQMGKAVADMQTFDEAYQQVDWSRFAQYPAFKEANRINAYGSYLLLERESLGKQ
ncbi:MBL fold metallo-hydrolase [Massilia sp. Root418]|nr:MBL fold metallo-hydrolase [Massilia sp. Root418]